MMVRSLTHTITCGTSASDATIGLHRALDIRAALAISRDCGRTIFRAITFGTRRTIILSRRCMLKPFGTRATASEKPDGWTPLRSMAGWPPDMSRTCSLRAETLLSCSTRRRPFPELSAYVTF
jgi:hypothetical protein